MQRRFFKDIFARAGHDTHLWPVALLVFAVVVPAVCLLWFMDAAMRNERLAARQKLADAYRGQLSSAQARLERHWNEMSAELEKLARATPAARAFAQCVQSGSVDSVVILDEQGRILYPNTPSRFEPDSSELEDKRVEANQLEFARKDFRTAAKRYDALAKEATNINFAARALQAEARCLVRSGHEGDAVRLINEVLGGERYRQATDAQGRVIAVNAELMALELVTNRTSEFQSTAQRLQKQLMDYDNPALAASQRRFLMKELQRLSPDIELPTLAAEELAAHAAESFRALPESAGLHRASMPGLWQFSTALRVGRPAVQDRRVLALVRADKLLARMQTIAAPDSLPKDTEIAVLPPDAENATAFVSLPAGAHLPGWRLALSIKDQQLFNTTTEHRAATYLWAGVLVIAAMAMLALLAVRIVRRQTALARLKNDLAATVSHELKTPLSSMRVLVDTLLESEKWNERTAREYLQLIAQENERLSRVIQNFLTFSRMEREKHTFQFEPVPARQIIEAAAAAVRERFDAPGCRFEVQTESDLPNVMADSDALTTALLNVLDNAYKYSEDIKHIVLSAHAENGRVLFSVRDNGIGIAPREAKKIFQPFHQVDARLSRKGSGCGLGLSIVQFIAAAHHGDVSVQSEPGRGSTFTIFMPIASQLTGVKREAIA